MKERTVGWAAGLIAAGAIAGGVLASTLSASAAPSPSSSAGAGSGTTTRPYDGTLRQRADETLLTGSNAAKARAAALKAVPGATVERVETDAEGAAYEAHVRRADGSRATVKLDKDFSVTSVEECTGRDRTTASRPA
ncbi:MAG: hypothetical protein ABR520_02295 [Mycobacteriales bacterium]